MASPSANLVRSRRGRAVLRAPQRINGEVYDEPLHKHDYGPLCAGGPGIATERLPILPGTYTNYRRMDRTPFIAMAKEFKLGPVRNAMGTWKTKDDTVSDDRLKFVQDSIEPVIANLISSLGDALSMGNSPNRILWELKTKSIPGAPSSHWTVKDVIPLNHEATRVRVTDSEDTEEFLGLTTRTSAYASKEIDLDVNEVVYFRYDPRPYDGYWWYGRSLHENHRAEFSEYQADRQLMNILTKKLAGVVAIAKIIKGMARDEKNNVINRFDAAKEIVQYLSASMGTVLEVVGVSEDELKKNPKLAAITDIQVEALDLGSSSPAYETMLKKRQQTQRECVMGYLVPPPAIMDVPSGGKGDTETKSESGLTQSEVIGLVIHQCINQQLVNPFLVLNFGPDAADTIYRAPTKFTEAQRLASDRIMAAMVNSPEIFKIALSFIDNAQVFRSTNTPMLKNIDSIDFKKAIEEEEAKQLAIAKASKPTPPTKPIAIKGGSRTKKSNNRGTGAV